MVDVIKLRELRNSSADPNSLVPIGNDRVAFVSDDVRHFMLKKRIQEQYKLHTKSNLVKESGGFGAGYASKDGKSVVGAAHGLEEMIKQAEIANRKFTDTGKSGGYDLPKLSDFSDYAAPSAPTATTTTNNNNNNHNTQDLLFGANPQQGTTAVGDLLDFSAEVSQPHPGVTAGADLLGGMSAGGTGDLLGTAAASDTISISLYPSEPAPAGGLLDFGAAPPTGVSADPFAAVGGSLDMGGAPTAVTPGDALGGVANSLLSLDISGGAPKEDNTTLPTAPSMMMAPDDSAKKSVMGGSMMGGAVIGGSIMSSNSDRFSALDSLEVPGAASTSSILSAREAENRLLGQSTSSSAPNPSMSLGDMVTPSFAISGSSTAPMPGMDLSSDPMGLSGVGSGLKVAHTVSTLELSSSWGGEVAPGDDDDGFVMGGTMGAGLEPLAPAPCAPPPPPPP